MTAPDRTDDGRPSLHDRKSHAMRDRICAATIACLDRLGYAETTFARIQDQAGVSRGAITHHFPTKQAVVAATAMRLLPSAARPIERRLAEPGAAPLPVRELMVRSWHDIVNTAGGRAMVEILVACRTDHALHDQLQDRLQDWDRASRASVARAYVGREDAADDAELLWSISRSFIRGLVIHAQFASSPDYLTRMIERYARMLETEMQPRDAPGAASGQIPV